MCPPSGSVIVCHSEAVELVRSWTRGSLSSWRHPLVIRSRGVAQRAVGRSGPPNRRVSGGGGGRSIGRLLGANHRQRPKGVQGRTGLLWLRHRRGNDGRATGSRCPNLSPTCLVHSPPFSIPDTPCVGPRLVRVRVFVHGVLIHTSRRLVNLS